MVEFPFWLLLVVFAVGALAGVAAVLVPLSQYKDWEEDEDTDSDLFV